MEGGWVAGASSAVGTVIGVALGPIATAKLTVSSIMGKPTSLVGDQVTGEIITTAGQEGISQFGSATLSVVQDFFGSEVE